MSALRKIEHERYTLYCADCLDVLPTLSDVDAVVTDPPYGIGYEHRQVTSGKWVTRHHNVAIAGDEKPFDPSPWLRFAEVILWGGNYYARRLPVGGWLVWDKRRGIEDVDFSMSDGEIAWTNTTKTLRIFRHLWFGLARDSEIGQHLHPTQKPVALMKWCLGFVDNETILAFMGSGSTGIACMTLGRKFVGIEIDPAYFDIAAKRIAKAAEVPPLFELVDKIEQANLFDP